jgi:hypothetical protein
MWRFVPLHRIILFSLLLILEGIGVTGEKIPVNNQTGWDGKHYANLTIHFEELAQQKQIDSYQYQRILTPAVIHYAAKIFGISLSPENIVRIFTIYNFGLILCAAILFFHLSTLLKLSPPTETVGFSILFLNFVTLKNTPYYPVLTDTTAFLMGLCLVYLFIRNKQTLLYLTVLVSQFCYPLMMVASFPLALNLKDNRFVAIFKKRSLFKIFAALIIGCIMIGFYLLVFVPNTLLPKYTMELNTNLLPASILLVGMYIWRGFAPLQSSPLTLNGQPKWLPVLGKVSGILFFWFCATVIINKISIPEEVFTPKVFVFNLLQQSIDNPLAFIVAHITYLGPGFILVIFFYKPFVNTIVSMGDSAIAYFLLMFCLSIGSETRQFIHFFPFITIVLAITLNTFQIGFKQAILFVLLSVVCSKCWFPINTPESFSDYNYMSFPNQRYFMNHGPFMSDQSYWINLLILVTTAAVVWLLFRDQLKTLKLKA